MTTSRALLTTEVPGLDTILNGGITPGSLVFLVGTPGAGKTVLATQILLGAVRAGSSALILTVFSEGHVKLLEHLGAFTFFDPEMIGRELNLLALQTVIGKDPDTAAAALTREIRQSGARLVLIDGFQGVVDVMQDEHAVQRMIAALASLASFLNITLLVTAEGAGRDAALSRTLTTADLVLNLEYTADGWRHVRRMEVIKQRGRAQLPGRHPYIISEDGVTVFPRVEVQPLIHTYPRPTGRAPFGLPELDALLGGGLTAGTATVLAGAPGVGKTTLALHWALEEATPELTTIFLSFGERPEQLHTKAATFGLDLDPAIASGALTLLRFSPVEVMPDMVVARLLATLTPATHRLVIDDIALLVHELGSRAPDYLTALAEHLYAAGITSMFLLELKARVGLRLDLATTPLSRIAENIIMVQQQIAANALHRVLAVLKMRYSSYDRTLRELVLDPQGVRVLSPGETAPGVLRDAAQTGGGFASPEE